MKPVATVSIRTVLLLVAVLSCHSVLIAQPDLQIRSVARLWPNIEVYYSVRCGGLLNLTHTQQQLTLREDGIPISQFTRQCPDTTAVGDNSFGLVLDGSGSTIGAPNRWIKDAAIAFIEKMHPSDEGAVLSYNAVPSLLQAMTPDTATLKYAVSLLTPSGQSGTYSAIHAALTYVGGAGSRSRRALIVLADGQDNSSLISPDSLIAMSVNLRIPLIMIGLGLSYPSVTFQMMADKTGGKLYQAVDSLQLVQVYRDAYEFIADGFESCRLDYIAGCNDGALRDVELSVQGVCGGSDSDIEQYRAIRDTTGFTQLVYDLQPVEAIASLPFVIPLNIAAVTPERLHPLEIDLAYFGNCMRFDSVSIPAGSPLTGMNISAIPVAGTLRLQSQATTLVSSPSPFLNLHFTAMDRPDSVSCSITITDVRYTAGCFTSPNAIGTVNIGVLPKPVITPGGRIVLCPGQSVVLTTPSGFDSYEWSTAAQDTSIVVDSSGSYTVTVMDRAGRIGTSLPVEVAYRTSPNPRLTHGPAITLCKGDTVFLGVSGTYTNYQWSTGPTSSSIEVKQGGMYYVTVTDDSGCMWRSDSLLVTLSDPQVSVTASGALEFCDGDEVTLDAGAGFAAYRWSNNEQTQIITVRNSGSYFVRVSDANGCTVNSDTFNVVVRTRPIAAIAPSGMVSLCPGATIILDGGQGYASWQWSTGFGGRYLSVNRPGSYGLRVIDSYGCVSELDSVAVALIPRPSLNVSDTVIICTSGRVDLDAGAGYQSYLWSNGASSRTISVNSPGRYFAQATINGCVLYSDTVIVEQRAQIKPVIAVNGPARICEGDSVRLDGGNYISWNWSTGESTRYITVRASGSYLVAVIDAYGCAGSSDPVTIATIPAPVPTITSSTPTRVCEGETVVLVASPGFADYRWSNGGVGTTISVSTSGAYSVTVTNAEGCSGTSNPTSVIVVPAPAKPIITRNVETLTSSPASAYQWMKDGAPISGVTGQSYVPVVSGSYAVRVFNADGCFSDSDPMTITITGIEAATSARPRALTMHPDPTAGLITVTADVGQVSGIDISVSNLLGQVVARYTDRSARGRVSHTMNIASSPNGVYLIQVRFGDRTTVRRIVKQ